MRLFALASLLGLAALGCHGPPHSSEMTVTQAPTPTTAATPESEAAGIFRDRCAVCHGAQGGGDGPAGMALTPRPRNFRDAAWHASMTDAQIERSILEGGAAVGKSAAMPPAPDLANRRPVLVALRAYVRSMRP